MAGGGLVIHLRTRTIGVEGGEAQPKAWAALAAEVAEAWGLTRIAPRADAARPEMGAHEV